MERVWLSSTYYLDPAVLSLSDGAEVLFTRTIAYCGAAETLGIVTETALKTLGVRALFRKKSELLRAGLIIELETGVYQLKGWDRWQKNGNALLKRRKSDRDRKIRQREREKLSRDTSRDVTGGEIDIDIEERTNHLSKSAQVSNASDPQMPTGPTVNAQSWKLVRDTVPSNHPHAVRVALAQQSNALIVAGTPNATVEAALALWMTKPNVGPGILPSLVSEVLKTSRTPALVPSSSTADQRVAQAQALKACGRNMLDNRPSRELS